MVTSAGAEEVAEVGEGVEGGVGSALTQLTSN